ncbi:hypothetical protein ACHEVJ_16105 [Enterococcus raffinosus]|uniref:Uncharacterized protein n=2 Tax=Enterococcus raffinosus TaxID=71452 RepID=R2R2T2_9ENTE|nr:hypothetical protein [Enterococcus raffinosus]EOH74941.1 hypothetical protein UAK_03805 [Enterococcus raffinosus ATCC 49464]EOT82120.1 hypothetical protein I590_00545 [Enterococcus raffinosus ATCC 49464]MDK7989627.1 hypothetical protein [Enterococcus raffinosus]MDT2537134.1 hypothetical protein [Enterococcus raffinosus]OJG76788.1 hypothetical protein RV13_GL003960 [Enterococcus raffinosus]
MPNYIYSGQSTEVLPRIIKIKQVTHSSDGRKLFITGDELDDTGNMILQNSRIEISKKGLSQGFNYSVGEAVGACLTAFGQPTGNSGAKSFDLDQLMGTVCIVFFHQKVTKDGRVYTLYRDLFPLQVVQFPWINVPDAGNVDNS